MSAYVTCLARHVVIAAVGHVAGKFGLGKGAEAHSPKFFIRPFSLPPLLSSYLFVAACPFSYTFLEM